MAYTYYPYMILLGDDSDFSLSQLADRLQVTFAKADAAVKLAPHADTLTLVLNGAYRFTITLNEGPSVLTESAEMAGEATANKSAIARCRRRLELSGDDDPGMDHFNDSVFILETLETFRGLYVYSPHVGFIRD
ncbi:MAG: hypothetical protein H7Z72_13980 [Bacteroidetes bacterium]|nr:hypothetical protein [Fibrella sp.]